MIKQCSECPNTFEAGNNRSGPAVRPGSALTCSKECSKARDKRLRSDKKAKYLVQWRKDNPNYEAERMAANPHLREQKKERARARRAADPSIQERQNEQRRNNRPRKQKKCIICGKQFEHCHSKHRVPGRRGPSSKTCSPACEKVRKARAMQEYQQDNADAIRDYAAQWRKDNPDKTKRYQANRNGVSSGIRKHLPALIYEFDGHCGICGDPLPDDHDKIHVHHIKPVKHGGMDDFENLAPTHIKCNLMVGARWDGVEPTKPRTQMSLFE